MGQVSISYCTALVHWDNRKPWTISGRHFDSILLFSCSVLWGHAAGQACWVWRACRLSQSVWLAAELAKLPLLSQSSAGKELSSRYGVGAFYTPVRTACRQRPQTHAYQGGLPHLLSCASCLRLLRHLGVFQKNEMLWQFWPEILWLPQGPETTIPPAYGATNRSHFLMMKLEGNNEDSHSIHVRHYIYIYIWTSNPNAPQFRVPVQWFVQLGARYVYPFEMIWIWDQFIWKLNVRVMHCAKVTLNLQ